MQLLRSTMLLVATLSFFGALRFLPLAEAASIASLTPIAVVLLSPWVLGERPGRARYAAALAGFVGVLILMRPGSEVFHPAALLLLVTAISNSLYAMLTRKLGGDSPYTTLFYSALVGTIALLPALPWAVAPDAWTWSRAALFVMLGLFAGVGHLLLTRSEEGMTLFSASGATHVPAQAREVFDVSGAGDTVVSVLAAMMALGRPMDEAMRLATRAGGIVVGKLGTAAVSPAELFGEAS